MEKMFISLWKYRTVHTIQANRSGMWIPVIEKSFLDAGAAPKPGVVIEYKRIIAEPLFTRLHVRKADVEKKFHLPWWITIVGEDKDGGDDIHLPIVTIIQLLEQGQCDPDDWRVVISVIMREYLKEG